MSQVLIFIAQNLYIQKNVPKEDNGSSLPISDRIILNKPVKKIEWDSESENPDESVKVTCRDGTIFQAAYVLMTASLGFLKQNAETLFQPSLPGSKTRAIEVLRDGLSF